MLHFHDSILFVHIHHIHIFNISFTSEANRTDLSIDTTHQYKRFDFIWRVIQVDDVVHYLIVDVCIINVYDILEQEDIWIALDILGNQTCHPTLGIVLTPRVEKILVTVGVKHVHIIGSFDEGDHTLLK